VTRSSGFGIVQAQELAGAGRGVFEELCELASSAAGLTFRPIVASSHRELAGLLERGDVGLAWLPPLPTIELEAQGVTTVLAIPSRNGSTTYHSALIVRRGGPRTIGDLRARRAVWVERASSSGYLVPRMHLASQGIDVLRYFSRELFVHSHPAVIDAVVNGEADVGATYCHVDGLEPPRRTSQYDFPSGGAPADTGPKVVRGAWIDDNLRSLRPIDVLATFGPIPNDALVGSNGLDASARSALARWCLDPSPRVRDLFGVLLGCSDFRVPTPEHYDLLRHMIRTARARGHDALPPSSRTGIRVARRV
jgi:phosphonate transport system substrate-binding protein